ncbi:zinc finger matrin-type protein 1-like [Sorex araneus]|uniref:zinc finger matrin-type protein 1-like n=1 Tax=Sorex araneus TaxID=42254 RepID=UPI002433E476|nr:zinc finger matrin-type protein 1-like [Sorex araneus]
MEISQTYDSFQHELEAYIRTQKARGLQPDVCFRKGTEDSAYREWGHTRPAPLTRNQRVSLKRSSEIPGSCEGLTTVENQLPAAFRIHGCRQTAETLRYCWGNRHPFCQGPWPPSPPVHTKTVGPHATPRRANTSRSLGDRNSIHGAGDQSQSQGTRSSEERGRRGLGEDEQGGRKRRHHTERGPHKEKRTAEGEPRSTGKPSCGKGSSPVGVPRKKRRKSDREKRRPGPGSLQERDLWDEAILGGCC